MFSYIPRRYQRYKIEASRFISESILPVSGVREWASGRANVSESRNCLWSTRYTVVYSHYRWLPIKQARKGVNRSTGRTSGQAHHPDLEASVLCPPSVASLYQAHVLVCSEACSTTRKHISIHACILLCLCSLSPGLAGTYIRLDDGAWVNQCRFHVDLSDSHR